METLDTVSVIFFNIIHVYTFNGLFPCEIPNPLSSFTQKAVVIQVVKVSGTFFVKDVSFRPL